jgi:septation ring formation regulator EzrA
MNAVDRDGGREARTRNLSKAAERRSEETLKRARGALIALHARGEEISYRTVAEEAGVSDSYLRKHPELSAQISALAGKFKPKAAPPSPTAATAASLRTKLTVTVERLKNVEEEARRLRQENEALRGEVLELRRRVRQR